jgi:poly(hydroxyalkanoate) depolymerase family esterase
VVVLHGCTQTAAGYDHGSGWSDLAERHGFALLFPEQRRENNANLCFNWFNVEDTRRQGGEAASIKQMIDKVVEQHSIGPTRIFVTGLSAGGAMTSVMLAAYPELFAGGGIIAGLPFGIASSVPQAFERMRGQGYPSEQVLSDRVRAASPHRGPWPRVSVWHGDADATVNIVNADRIIEQWRALQQVGATPTRSESIDGHLRSVWLDRAGNEVIEQYRIHGVGHGVPISTTGPDGCGVAGPFMIEAGISSTRCLAASWGLLGDEQAMNGANGPEPSASDRSTAAKAQAGPATTPSISIQAVIEKALRHAGLMR